MIPVRPIRLDIIIFDWGRQYGHVRLPAIQTYSIKIITTKRLFSFSLFSKLQVSVKNISWEKFYWDHLYMNILQNDTKSPHTWRVAGRYTTTPNPATPPPPVPVGGPFSMGLYHNQPGPYIWQFLLIPLKCHLYLKICRLFFNTT